MFIIPVIIGGWRYFEDVLRSWQTINAGMLAFMASVIALNMSNIKAEKERKRRFISARAFLPQCLSDLHRYLEEFKPLIDEILSRIGNDGRVDRSKLINSIPDLQISFKKVFEDCIFNSDDNVGEYLANIINLLQVHQSRVEYSYNLFGINNHSVVIRTNVLTHIFNLAEIKILIDNLFGFARGEEEFSKININISEINESCRQLDYFFELYRGLEEFNASAVSAKY
jgi:hypothetical protein